MLSNDDDPSSADPSNLAGERLESEEDVLHVRHLPEFGGYLRASDAEVLLQSLLVPYLRVPLLLRFFAEPTRTMALAHAPLQRVLDAALFEPGEWQPDEPKALSAHSIEQTIDDFVMRNVNAFNGRNLVSAETSSVDLNKKDGGEEKDKEGEGKHKRKGRKV